MRRSWIILLSLGLNVVLAFVLISHRRKNYPQTKVEITTPADSNAANPHFIVRKQFFTWHELESPDYQEYVKNLRGINCPEQTISDLVMADVNQEFAYRRLTEIISPVQEWWRSQPDPALVAKSVSQKQALEQSRRALLTGILGTNWLSAPPPRNFQVFLTGPVLGELATETKHAVLGILQRADHNTTLYENTQVDEGSPDPKAEAVTLATIDRDTRKDLALVLTPAQYEEYLLRYSDSAETLRRELPVQMTQDEFRQIFRRADALEQQLSIELVTANSTGDRKEYDQLDAKITAIMSDVLGPERFSAYLYQKDPVYHDVVDRINEAGAPLSAASDLYTLEVSTQNTRNQILNDPNLTDAQKQDRINKLEQREEQASNQLLGLTPAAVAPAAAQPPPAPQAAVPASFQVHAYNPGETVDQIAAQFGVSAASILNANPDVNFNGLNRNQPIRIPKP